MSFLTELAGIYLIDKIELAIGEVFLFCIRPDDLADEDLIQSARHDIDELAFYAEGTGLYHRRRFQFTVEEIKKLGFICFLARLDAAIVSHDNHIFRRQANVEHLIFLQSLFKSSFKNIIFSKLAGPEPVTRTQ